MLARTGSILALAGALLLAGSPAVAQYDQQRSWHRNSQQQFGPGTYRAGPQGAACIPSGFARLGRNCNVNTGGCQRMPEQCNLGWCCP